MRQGYTIRPKADKDIDDCTDDLVERGSLEVGLHFLSSAIETFELVATQPEMGWVCRLRHPELKDARVFRISEPFEKFLIFYQPQHGRIEILRVLHGAQDLEQRLLDEGVL